MTEAKQGTAVAEVADWIDWHGGDCPVPRGTVVSVRLRGGGEATRLTYPEALVWSHIFEPHDIVAYRVET